MRIVFVRAETGYSRRLNFAGENVPLIILFISSRSTNVCYACICPRFTSIFRKSDQMTDVSTKTKKKTKPFIFFFNDLRSQFVYMYIDTQPRHIDTYAYNRWREACPQKQSQLADFVRKFTDCEEWNWNAHTYHASLGVNHPLDYFVRVCVWATTKIYWCGLSFSLCAKC